MVVVSSPSGGGKTTLVKRLVRRVPGLVRSVSVTTRPPRAGERRGSDYRFISPAAFQRLRQTRQLLEWARVHGAWYGTPKAPARRALAQGRDVILSIDVQGARQIRRALGTRATLVFLLPPSLEDLRRRLRRRRTETPTAMRRRLAVARREIACAVWYDVIVVNDRLDQAIRDVGRAIRAGRANRKGS